MNHLNHILNRESALPAVLSGRQMSMVAFGTVISYGLVSGSALPLLLAGPAAFPAYVAAALVVLALMAGLSRLAAQYPTPGAFGSYAECTLGPATGFLVRAAYLASLVLIIGTEVSLLVPVLAAWLPQASPVWLLAGVLAMLTLVNMAGAHAFARCEVAFSMLKVGALIALIGLAFHYATQGTSTPAPSSSALTSVFGAVPFTNVWQAFMLATLGFVGIESLAIVAAETRSSGQGLRRTLRITTFAVVGLTLAAVAAASALLDSGVNSLSRPLFATLLDLARLPWSNTLFRVLVLVTILSVLNSQIYCASRMLFSLARAGQAPAMLGRSSRRGPVRAVAVTGGLSIAVLGVNTWLPGYAYVVATSIAISGLLFVWLAIFLTHARRDLGRDAMFRRPPTQSRLRAVPAIVGAAVVAAIAGSTLVIDEFAATLHIGLPFLLVLWLGYVGFAFLSRSTRSTGRASAMADRLSAPFQAE